MLLHNLTKKSLSAALLLILMGGCKKDFLDVLPKGKLIAEKTNDYNLLLNSLDFLNVDIDTQIPMGDEVAAAEPYFSGAAIRTQRLFRWDDVVYEPNENNPEITTLMRHIYQYNKIINEVMTSTGGTEQQKKSLRAEAQASRAWCNFMLVNYFGKPYNEATAATDPSCPINTASDVTREDFTRASVKEVYDHIIADLTAAIPELSPKVLWRLRMSKACGEALLGKVYVFMGRYLEALPLLNAAFASLEGGAVPVRLYDYNTAFATGGVFLPITILGPNSPTASSFEEVLFAKQIRNDWAFLNSELSITPEVRSLYNAADHRLKLFSNAPFGGTGYPVAGMFRRIGVPGSRVYVGMILSDMLLLRAECKARTNDLTGAKTDVETLRAKRMPAANVSIPAGLTQVQLIDYIINEERLREFALTGYRWFDMRRMSVDPLFKDKVYKHRLYSETGTITEYTMKPERLVIRYSQRIMDRNPGMTNNP